MLNEEGVINESGIAKTSMTSWLLKKADSDKEEKINILYRKKVAMKEEEMA